jgi:hypothetical protein
VAPATATTINNDGQIVANLQAHALLLTRA